MLTEAEKRRMAEIVSFSREKPGTFDFAFWFGGTEIRKQVERFYFVGGLRTPFRAYYSNDKFGRSYKERSSLIREVDRKLPDREVTALLISAVEAEITRRVAAS